MKKLIPFIFLAISVIFLAGCGQENKTYYFDEEGNMSTTKPATAKVETADKLEVYYFHRTARCYSCNTMGELVTNLINERYGQQVKEGKIDFKQLNVELPENKEIAKKFQATGSSLFINRIMNGKDKIEQDADVWRYLSSAENFNEYLGKKIDSYLGL